MNELSKAYQILRAQGARALLERSAGYLRYVFGSKFWRSYYRLYSAVTGKSEVSVNGVTVDTSVGLAPKMVNKLRTKRYETDETRLIRSALRPDSPVIDLGAGIGYTAVIAETTTDASVPVVAVEANPALLPVIKRTRELNDCSFDVVSAAYSTEAERVSIYASEDILESTTDPRERSTAFESTDVDTISLEAIFRDRGIDGPYQLLVDIEGSEGEIFSNELELLAESCSLMIVEFHPSMGCDVDEYVRTLGEIGFELVDVAGDVSLFSNESMAD